MSKEKLARVFHFDLYGKREDKYDFLSNNSISTIAWNFYFGGYQPAQKWLKDRKGRKLEFDDILHYQKIIVALSETDRLMKGIDDIEID